MWLYYTTNTHPIWYCTYDEYLLQWRSFLQIALEKDLLSRRPAGREGADWWGVERRGSSDGHDTATHKTTLLSNWSCVCAFSVAFMCHTIWSRARAHVSYPLEFWMFVRHNYFRQMHVPLSLTYCWLNYHYRGKFAPSSKANYGCSKDESELFYAPKACWAVRVCGGEKPRGKHTPQFLAKCCWNVYKFVVGRWGQEGLVWPWRQVINRRWRLTFPNL